MTSPRAQPAVRSFPARPAISLHFALAQAPPSHTSWQCPSAWPRAACPIRHCGTRSWDVQQGACIPWPRTAWLSSFCTGRCSTKCICILDLSCASGWRTSSLVFGSHLHSGSRLAPAYQQKFLIFCMLNCIFYVVFSSRFFWKFFSSSNMLYLFYPISLR